MVSRFHRGGETILKFRFLLTPIVVLLLVLSFCGKANYPTKTSPTFLAESIHTGCKDGSERLGRILGGGAIILSSFNDTIRVMHANAHYNCCADIETEVEKTNYGFEVREKDEGFACGCTCDFDVTTFIYGVAAGTYLVRVFDIDGNRLDQGYVIVRPKKPDGPNG